jgi:hypothetical protein
MPENGNDRALSTEEMLANEAKAIHGDEKVTLPDLLRQDAGQQKQKFRLRINADERSGTEVDAETVEARRKLYIQLNALNRGALCFSGGGIRSATFCLGILQALAAYDATPLEVGPNEPQPDDNNEITPTNSLLGRFHYLSTVSGGGYVGSWLSSWRHRDAFATILKNLIGRPSGPDVEPPEISWLRAYSNYLTPRIGVASADTWAAVAIVVRNLLLNWLVIIPVVCVALLLLKIIATIGVWIAHGNNDKLVLDVLLIGVAFLIVAQAFTTYHRPARRPPAPAKVSSQQQPGNASEGRFLWGDLLWSVLSAIAVTIFFSSMYYSSNGPAGWPAFGAVAASKASAGSAQSILAAAVAGAAIYAVGWLSGLVMSAIRWLWQSCRGLQGRGLIDGLRNLGPKLLSREFVTALWDFVAWALSGLVYGSLVGLGAVLFSLLGPYAVSDNNGPYLLLAIIVGVPWVLMAQMVADNIFGGLVSYEPLSDSDREWLGRAAGWVVAVAISWAVLAFLVFAGAAFVQFIANKGWVGQAVTAAGGVTGILSGIVTAILGKSSLTPAQSSSDDQGASSTAANIALAIAGPLFVAVLIVAVSVGLDELLLRDTLPDKLLTLPSVGNTLWPILKPLLIALGVGAAIGLAASSCVNINRFSLHALYRNRLTRAYLGASRQERHPDLFTGFDVKDNVRMHELWPPQSAERRLFHVVNIALNVVATKRLAWQERKAESFIVTPRHCGSAYLGFRPSEDYGDSMHKESGSGIALGTAMAISGAAVSSNMGYHSSPSLALLLTMFNVRLGWWLGNPGPAGNKEQAFRREGPRWSAKPLFYEAFGQTTDTSAYVYLSDGGHFENLGLYEMVRRRCRFIIVVDAGCDPDFSFEDLGNAVRKIYIDLGIRIEFKELESLCNRPTGNVPPPRSVPYCAIGTIEYDSAGADGPDCENGKVIYIKPAYHGTEGAAIRSYAIAHKTFPHETTVDQWFTESQFESYRALGLDIANNVLRQKDVRDALHDFLKAPVHHHAHA